MISPEVLEMEPSIPPEISPILEVELWDDDTLFGAHEAAAADLLDEYVRTEDEQKARDEIARKAIGIITSAVEGTFTDASKKFRLIDSLVASLGALCDHNHLNELLDKHADSRNHHTHEEDDDAADEDESESRGKKISKGFSFVAKPAGSLAVGPLFPAIRRLLKSSY